MKKSAILISIGIFSGIVLALFLKITQLLTGNQVYYLLFDTEYIPVLQNLRPIWFIETAFHFTTCIISIAVLYKLLSFFNWEKNILIYILVFGVGSAILYFLTIFSEKSPPVTNISAWIYWTIGHLLFSITAGVLIKKWIPSRA